MKFNLKFSSLAISLNASREATAAIYQKNNNAEKFREE